MSSTHILGDWRTETDRFVKIGGQWRRVVGVQEHIGGQWREATGYTTPLTASADPSVYGAGNSRKPTLIVSDPATVTPAGGRAPYSYSWSRVSGDAGITATSPSMATTTFQAILYNTTATAVFQYTVTDGSGQTATGTTNVSLYAGTA